MGDQEHGDIMLDYDGIPFEDDPTKEDPIATKIMSEDFLICSIVLCILAIVGIVANALMLRAWVKYALLRTDFYTVFAFLSVSDMLFIAVSVPAGINDMLLTNSTEWCKFSRYFMYVFGFISALLLVVLSTLRAILLTNRNTIPRPRAKHLGIICVVIYIVVFCISIPIFSMHGAYNRESQGDSQSPGYSQSHGDSQSPGVFMSEPECYYVYDVDDIKQTWLLSSFSTFVPLSLMFLFYSITYLLGKRFFDDSYSPREKQLSRLVNCTILAFIVCQIPYRVVSIYENYLDPVDGESILTVLRIKDYFTCLLVFGKVIPPILCSKLTIDLGHAFDEIINCQCCYKRLQNSSGSLMETSETHVFDTCSPQGAAAADPDWEADPESPSPLPLATSPSRTPVDRSISTSSSASQGSQAPLIRNSPPTHPIEML